MIYSLAIFGTLLLRDESLDSTRGRSPDATPGERLELELEHLVVNQELLDFVHAHTEDEFLLIEDSDLTTTELEVMLSRLGVPRFYLAVYLSGERGVTKAAQGALFGIAQEEYGQDIVHIGDRFKEDFLFATNRLSPAIHYVKQSYEYQPVFDSGESYYRNYVEDILCPLMYISVERIKSLVAKNDIHHIVCLGSVYEFYRDLLEPHFPQLEITKLEISRFNIRFVSFLHTKPKEFVRLRHTESFLHYYYPEAFERTTGEDWATLTVFQKWKTLGVLVEEVSEDLTARAQEVEQSLSEQIRSAGLDRGGVLFVDFGYQGTFCELLDYLPVLDHSSNVTFLTVKEENPKHSCEYAVQVQPFRMPVKEARDPFWILDAEILIKRGSKTPLAFRPAHQNSLGWPEMYDHLLACVTAYRPPTHLYGLQRELTFKILRHICTLSPATAKMFNWLCDKVQYSKYSISGGEGSLLGLVDGVVQLDISQVAATERAQHGHYEFENSAEVQRPFPHGKGTPFYLYFKYLESIGRADALVGRDPT